MGLLECVPNISEGRRLTVIDSLWDFLRLSPGVHCLDRSSDWDHNRTVFTLAGEPLPLQEALVNFYGKALQSIDLRHHDGVHPRIGAVDVIPFVPLAEATMEEAVQAARSLSRRLATTYQVPIFLYGMASELNRTLPAIRRGGFEKLGQTLKKPPFPDSGPRTPHLSGGATAVGARFFLVAFNVWLPQCRDLGAARHLASLVREREGGLLGVKSLGLKLASRECVQVSLNLVDYRQTGPGVAFKRIQELAQEYDLGPAEPEFVGLVPRAALEGAGLPSIVKEAADGKILEDHLARIRTSR